ncbi:MAG: hypothetical protein KDC38_06045 [Planctomycetes bacterium]|nr:hypothetical protein [Planctomycetota bacterium]
MKPRPLHEGGVAMRQTALSDDRLLPYRRPSSVDASARSTWKKRRGCESVAPKEAALEEDRSDDGQQ